MRRLVVALVLGLILVGPGSPRPAFACSLSVPGPTGDEQLASATLVFEGVAVSSRDPNAGAPIISSADPIYWSFAVDRELKGAAGPVREVATARSDASCGYSFRIGLHYRVFVTDRGGVLTTGLGSGTREAPLDVGTAPVLAPVANPILPSGNGTVPYVLVGSGLLVGAVIVFFIRRATVHRGSH